MSELLGTTRASGFAEIFDCGLRFYTKVILGIRRPAGMRAHLGTAIHAGTAAFDRAAMERNPIRPDDAVEVFVDTLAHPREDVRPMDDDPSPKECESIGIKLLSRYCTEISPRYTFRAVEDDGGKLDIQTEHGVIELTGHLDRTRLVDAGSDLERIMDHKSGLRAVGADGTAVTKGHHLQLGIYRLIEQAKGFNMDKAGEICGLQTNDKARIGIGVVDDIVTPLVGTAEQPGLIELAAHMFKTGSFPPNPRSILCGPKYCDYYSQCIYHD